MKKLKILILITLVFLLTKGYSLAYDPTAVQAYNQGVEQIREKNYQKAIEYFNEAIEADPKFSDAYYNLGVAYDKLDNTEKTLENFMQVLKYNPKDEEVSYFVAKMLYEKGEYSKAFVYANSVTSKCKYSKEAKMLLEKIQHNLNRESKTKLFNSNPNKIVDKTTYEGIQSPTGMVQDSKGNIYVANFSANSIVKFMPDGSRKTYLKGDPLKGPIGIAIDSYDNLYVANYLSDSVLKITAEGEIINLLPKVSRPYCLYVNNSDELFVSSQGEHSLIKVRLYGN